LRGAPSNFSIILGLGITQLVTGLGRLIQARLRVRLYWPTRRESYHQAMAPITLSLVLAYIGVLFARLQ
jgi:hypothetical protein